MWPQGIPGQNPASMGQNPMTAGQNPMQQWSQALNPTLKNQYIHQQMQQGAAQSPGMRPYGAAPPPGNAMMHGLAMAPSMPNRASTPGSGATA
jgi:hypothetical protein